MTDAGTVMGEYMFLGLRTTSQAGRRCVLLWDTHAFFAPNVALRLRSGLLRP